MTVKDAADKYGYIPKTIRSWIGQQRVEAHLAEERLYFVFIDSIERIVNRKTSRQLIGEWIVAHGAIEWSSDAIYAAMRRDGYDVNLSTVQRNRAEIRRKRGTVRRTVDDKLRLGLAV